MMTRFVEKKIGFLYWYARALGLLAVGMRGILLGPEVGSPIGWIARIAQYLAGIYFVIAVVSARGDAQAQGSTVNVVIADIFSRSQREISTIIESMTDCHFAMDREWRFTRINDRALSFFNRRRGLHRPEPLGGPLHSAGLRLRGAPQKSHG